MDATAQRIETLTSLRFFAALAIVLYHLPGLTPSIYAGHAFDRANLGVDFFFILSGYVLGVTYAGAKTWSIGDYFKRRFARIYPLYALTLIVWTALWINDWPIPMADKFNSGIAHVLLVQSFFSGFTYTLGFNAVAWTISCEAFFYAVFPFFRTRGALAFGFSTLAVTLCLMLFAQDPISAIYPNFFGFFPPAVLWKFCLGVALAQTWKPAALEKNWATLAEIAALALILALIVWPSPLGSFGTLAIAAAMTAAIGVFACESGSVSRLLRARPLVLMGEASYALYLWHHMLMLWIGKRLPEFANPGEQLAAAALIIASMVAISVVTYLWFERPARAWIIGAGRPHPAKITAGVKSASSSGV